MSGMAVEVCIDCTSVEATAAAVAAAAQGGATTIELCRDMAAQGLTPDAVDLQVARTRFPRPGLLVMIRPRGGDFDYDGAALQQMNRQIGMAAEHGADGIVFGVLAGNRVNADALQALLQTARRHALRTTFHRAFDVIAEPITALDQLIDAGIDRVMTSGTPWGSAGGALAGQAMLARLIEHAGSRIEIVIGGGVAATQVAPLLAGIPWQRGRVSLHAYASVQREGLTDAAKVAELVQAASTATR